MGSAKVSRNYDYFSFAVQATDCRKVELSGENKRAAQQIEGREGETAVFLSRCLLTFSLRVFGFAPRHLNRWAARVGFYGRDD